MNRGAKKEEREMGSLEVKKKEKTKGGQHSSVGWLESVQRENH